MHRGLTGLIALCFACACDAGGCGCGGESGDEPPAELELETGAAPADEASEADGDPEQDNGFQVFSYDLEPYGAARGVWESTEIDGSRIVREVERTGEGDGRVTVTRDGELVVGLYVVKGVMYTVRADRCRATAGEMSLAMRKLPGLVPLDGVAVTVYGVLGDGVPEAAAEPLDEAPPDGGPARKGYRFRSEHDTNLYDVEVRGKVWMDGEDRPVRSEGKVGLEPLFGEEEPATAAWSFAIEPREEVAVELPAACSSEAEQVAAMKELPRLEDPELLSEAPGSLIYRAPGTVREALSLYREDLVGKGWSLEREGQSERTGTFVFRRPGEQLTVIATKKGGEVTVIISHAN